MVKTIQARARIGLLMAALLGGLMGCETQQARVPGLSLAFPESAPGYVSAKAPVGPLQLMPATDRRRDHLGRDVAGSGWQACADDTLPAGGVARLVDERLQQALEASRLFAVVQPSPAGWQLTPEVQVFCAQTRGFIGRRVAGLVGLKLVLRKDGALQWERLVEQVVTDADAAYTGSFVTTVEQAMRRTMADSLRVVLRDALTQIDAALPRP